MKRWSFARKIALALAAFALTFGLTLAPALAANISASSLGAQRSQEDIEAAVSSMLAAGDYTEGEAIVCSLKASSGAVPLNKSGAADLLASAEGLATVTKDQFNEAVSLSADEPGDAARVPVRKGMAADEIEISLVHRDDMSTEELLVALLEDSRVLSAEPNYSLDYCDDEEFTETVDVVDVDADVDTADPVDAEAEADAAVEPAAAEPVSEPATKSEPAILGAAPANELLAAEAAGTDRYASTSFDLSGYQWMSQGSASIIPEFTNGTNPGINSPSWNIAGATNSSGVIAIMDSGVDYTHPDLANVMYRFSPELQAELGCGEYGYAPIRDDVTDPMDGYGHGTHCAGIAAAEWNGFGVSGTASGAKILAISVSRSIEDSYFGYDSIIRGYDFMIRAVKAGVDIRSVNRSLEAAPTNTANQAMVIAAGDLGIVTCVASGNNGQNMDVDETDSSMYQDNPYILRVNASKAQDDSAWFTNYGTYTADVYAPGVAILSTIPSTKANFSRYFPQADDDPLFLETDFDGAPYDAYSSNAFDPTNTTLYLDGVSAGTVGVDGDGKSLAVDVTLTTEGYATFYVDVPVDSLSFDDIQDVSVSVYSPTLELRFLSVGVLLEDGTYTSDIFDPDGVAIQDNSFGATCDWGYASFHLFDRSVIGSDIQYVTDSQGRKCMRLAIMGQMQDVTHNETHATKATIYVDRIAIGKPGNSGFLPYQYMNGTSMATPVVTGAAAVVSSSIQGVSLAERASQTVQLLKGTVHQSDGYKDLCKQNGQIDLSFLTGQVALTPVLNAATTRNNTLVLSGANFGSTGTLTVNGVAVPTLSWSETEITAAWPAGLESGMLRLSVTSAAGKTAQRAFALGAPSSAATSAELYERDLEPLSSIPGSPSIMAAPQSLTVDEEGTIFAVAASGEERLNPTVRYLMRSEDSTETWSLFELPKELKNISLAAGDGTVYIIGATPADDPTAIDHWYLYAFDMEDESFELLNSYEMYGEDGQVTNSMALAYVKGHLYCVDCMGIENYIEDVGWDDHHYIRVRLFADDYSLLDTYTYILDHDYHEYGFYDAPTVSVADGCFYVLTVERAITESDLGKANALQRVDVADDGTLTSVDLSDAIKSVSSKPANVSIAACDQGVFMLGLNLDALASDGAPATDTYFLKKDETSFESFGKRLSFGPTYSPCAICVDGWLYAYATSNYEAMVQFGRATKLAEVKTGWLKEDGRWHYYLEDGTQLKSDWVKYEGKWYYFDETGELLREGWVSYAGAWYYFKDYTPMKEGWATYAGKYYYLKNYRVMQEGWASYQGTWYYFRNYALLVNDWVSYDGRWCHFNAQGACDMVI